MSSRWTEVLKTLLHEASHRRGRWLTLASVGWKLLRQKPLDRGDLDADPFRQFDRWYADARACGGQALPDSFALSTLDDQGAPDSRFVLLKDVSRGGFVFYTNLNSPKARALAKDPRCSLLFHWDRLGRQVRVRGVARPVDAAEADAYFRSRPRLSQVGAWASEQSVVLKDRAELEEKVSRVEARYAGAEVPRPPHWSGFRVAPNRFEFWQHRLNRLHDRFRYSPAGGGWDVARLSP
jgi:pyridoxamine 5'-phosphate oxidase